ncbi:MAG: hypothetical protein AAF446_07250 [Pseudomonadota bacterium]
MSHSSESQHLADQIAKNHAVVLHIDTNPARYPRLNELQHWQRMRLRATYDDLKSQQRYREACIFFLEELYGGRDMRERDRQLERVVPIMRRFLPEHLLHAIGEAMRLQWISMQFDAELSRLIDGELNQPSYAAAYRQMGEWQRREEQIQLIGELGQLLDETVKRKMIRRMLRWMHGPAVAAGFGELQEFLVRGIEAFAAMGDASEFVGTIVSREREALAAMRDGVDWPFERWIGQGPVEAGDSGYAVESH